MDGYLLPSISWVFTFSSITWLPYSRVVVSRRWVVITNPLVEPYRLVAVVRSNTNLLSMCSTKSTPTFDSLVEPWIPIRNVIFQQRRVPYQLTRQPLQSSFQAVSINTINTVRARKYSCWRSACQWQLLRRKSQKATTLTSVFNDRLLHRRSNAALKTHHADQCDPDSWLVEDLDAALKKDYLGPAHHVGLARVPSILNFTDAGGFDATITMIYLVPEWTSCFIVIRFLPKFCRSTTRVCDSIVWFPL